jgi:hypothetical protein
VIDAQVKCQVLYLDKYMITHIGPVLSLARDVTLLFMPCVYDSLMVIRPSCNFRDGSVVKNSMVNFGRYFAELPFNDSYLFGLTHLIPVDYKTVFRSSYS